MDTKDLLIQAIKDAAQKAIAEKALPEGELPQVILEVPPKKELGDFASNIAMQSARVFHAAPRKIAEEIVNRLEAPFLEKTGALESQIYLAYDQLKKHRDNVGITCYEIIMPNPIQQFALTTIKKQAIFSENDVELVEHSDRFSIKKRIQELPDFFTRSMKQNEIYYPFWENETRAWEQVWDLILIIQTIWGFVGISFIIVLIKTVDCKNLLLLRKGCIGSPSENATKLWIKPTDNRF